MQWHLQNSSRSVNCIYHVTGYVITRLVVLVDNSIFTSKSITDITHITAFVSPGKCVYQQDLVVLVDTSAITTSKLNQLKEFLRATFLKFDVGGDNTRIAFVTFGSVPNILSYLGRQTIDEVLLQMQSIRPSEASLTRTGFALSKVLDEVLTTRAGARENVTWNILVITDGRSKVPLAPATSY